MAKWWQLAAVAALGLILGLSIGGLYLGRNGRAAVVDLDRVFKESALAKGYQKKLDERARAREEEIAKIANTQEKAAKTEQYRNELTALQQEYRTKVLDALDAALAELARKRGLEVVYVRGGSVRYARVDLTEEAIRRLR